MTLIDAIIVTAICIGFVGFAVVLAWGDYLTTNPTAQPGTDCHIEFWLIQPNKNRHPMTSSARLLYVLLSQLLLLGFLAYNYLVFFQTDKIVGGALAIGTALVAIAVTATRLLPSNSLSLLQDYVFFVHRNIVLWLVLMTALWLLAVAWSYQMSSALFGRFLYVKELQNSLDRGALDRASLPDPEALARAFSRFPNRREVPVLLGRSSRLLYEAGRSDLFRTFQRTFLERLDIGRIVGKACATEKGKSPRHDSIAFLLSIVGEAYASVPGLSFEDHQRDIQQLMARFSAYHASIERCSNKTLEAKFQLVKFEDTINDCCSAANVPQKYDIDHNLRAFEQELNSASHQAVLDFWQSHGGQEYLDFLSYKLLSNLNLTQKNAVVPDREALYRDAIARAMMHYERLLLIRQRSLRLGDVEWSSPPHKLTLFYAFMLDTHIHSLVWEDMAAFFGTSEQLKSAVAEFTNRKVFDEFRSPRGWYAGTPLDFSLNGGALVDKINAWLKTDW